MLPISSISTSFLDWPSDEHAAILFIAGCGHHCRGCQSPVLQDPSAGRMLEVEEGLVDFIYDYCVRNRTRNLVLSGGDPLSYPEDVQRLMDMLKDKDPDMRFCIYTGFDYEAASAMVHGYDFIKCGRYVMESARPSSKDDDRMVLASPNQRMYDGSGRCLSRDGVVDLRRAARPTGSLKRNGSITGES